MSEIILKHEAGTLSYDDDMHQYWIDGEMVPSVSQVLKAGGLGFKGRPGPATQRGTDIHAATVEAELLGGTDTIADDIKGPVEQWLMFLDIFKARTVSVECPVFSVVHRYAGRFDRMLMIGGDLTLIDIKTGSKAASHAVQLAGYALAWHELKRPKITNYMVVYLEDAKFSTKLIGGFDLAVADKQWLETLSKAKAAIN
jgi:hypothetical protein